MSAFHLPTPLTIRQITQENYRTRTFVLDGRLDAEPGQFVMAWLPRFDEKPFSLVSGNPVTLMVTAVGPFSQMLHEKSVGDRLWIRGAFGQGYMAEPEVEGLALVGGGYGVAPLLWLARSQMGRARRIAVIIGARTAVDVLYADRFTALKGEAAAQGTELSLHITTEDGSLGRPGRVTDALTPLVEAKQVQAIHACGPHGMLAALEGLAQTHHIPAQLSWEAYMRCGIGICGSCEHEGKVLCMDGPVLAAMSGA
jgi:dihydroorotate dehydrogenase electron transfer subunit